MHAVVPNPCRCNGEPGRSDFEPLRAQFSQARKARRNEDRVSGSLYLRNRSVHRLRKAVDDHIQLGIRHVVGRREQYVISTLAVDRPAARIDEQSPLEGSRFDPIVHFLTWSEGLSGFPFPHELQGQEETSTAYITDKGMSCKSLVESRTQMTSRLRDAGQQTFLPDDPLDCQRCGASNGVCAVGMSVDECSRAGVKHLIDCL